MVRSTQLYVVIYYSTKYTLPLMTGLIVGFAFSLLFMPFFDCDIKAADVNGRIQSLKGNDLKNQELDDFEPRINLQGKPKKPQKATNKLIRPRYAATELGIREKLFIGVLVNNQNKLTSLTTFLNQSLTTYANKLMFFINNLDNDDKSLNNNNNIASQGFSVINFNDNHEILKPFNTFKYIIENHINNYDWFVLLTDSTFVRGDKLLTLINHLSISQDLYMGHSVDDLYCSLESGIIFSNILLQKLSGQMEWCINNAFSNQATDNIGRCVLHTTNLACAPIANGHLFTSFHNSENMTIDNDFEMLKSLPNFNDSITFYPARDYETFLKLQLYFNRVEVDEINLEIKNIEKNILDMACESPEGCNGITWPLGVPSPFHPNNRYEVIRWDFFNETHIYLEGDFDVTNELSEDYKYDIKEVIDYSIRNLNEPNSGRFWYRSLINGYKQFDPTRGATYILDLSLWDTEKKVEIHKRVNVMRPLGLIEFVSIPYVTENSKITIIVTFSLEYDKEQIDAFFLNYENNVLEITEVAEKINLYVVYVKMDSMNLNANLKNEMEENFKYIKIVINELEKKYSSLTTSSSRIIQMDITISNYTLYLNENYRQLMATEFVSNKLTPDSLMFVTPPGVEFQLEFLNRIRLNTIKANQVFAPIAFYQYNPNIIYVKKPFPNEVEVNKNVGYYNIYSYDFISFYNSDYMNTRDHFIENELGVENKSKLQKNFNLADHILDLYELFIKNETIHTIRATDASLKYRWHLVDNCQVRHYLVNNSDSFELCLLQLEKSLGNRAQLALHVIQLYKDDDTHKSENEKE